MERLQTGDTRPTSSGFPDEEARASLRPSRGDWRRRDEQSLAHGFRGVTFRCSRVRVPGGAVLDSWGSGAALTASERKVGGDSITKVILFYNGWPSTTGPGQEPPPGLRSG